MKKVITYLSALVLLGSVIGAWVFADDRWAKAQQLFALECRLDQKIDQDKANWIQQRIWTLEDRYSQGNMPVSVKEEYRQLKKQLNKLLNKLRKRS